MATQLQINGMNRFLNPPRGGMNNAEYQNLRREKAVMWNNFVKAQMANNAIHTNGPR